MDRTNEQPTPWGAWVKERARIIGFRRQQDLAIAVGCNPNQLSRWISSDEPPRRMFKGFDSSLARALRTDQHTLFYAYASTRPEATPILGEIARAGEESFRDELRRTAELLTGDRLRALCMTARSLLTVSAA